MVSVKWLFVFLLLAVVCSAQNSCTNKVTAPTGVVKTSNWDCNYTNGKLLISGDVDLEADIADLSKVQAFVKISGRDPLTSNYRDIMHIIVGLCQEYETQWMGKWQQIPNYGNMPTNNECVGKKLDKGMYKVKNWPVTAGFMNFWPLGTYKVEVNIAEATITPATATDGEIIKFSLPIVHVVFDFVR